jgi:hypothetical protein
MTREENIILSEQELFNLLLDTHTELSKMGATGLVSKVQVILDKIKEVSILDNEVNNKYIIAWRIYDELEDAYYIGNGTSKLGKIWSEEINADKQLTRLNRLFPYRFSKELIRIIKE